MSTVSTLPRKKARPNTMQRGACADNALMHWTDATLAPVRKLVLGALRPEPTLFCAVLVALVVAKPALMVLVRPGPVRVLSQTERTLSANQGIRWAETTNMESRVARALQDSSPPSTDSKTASTARQGRGKPESLKISSC